MSTTVSLKGTLTRDPELRFTQSGKPVANFTVVTARRYKDKDTGEWTETDTSFWDCTVFDTLAENVVESCEKGNRVVVTGVMKQDSYTTKEGEKRSTWRVTADEVAVSLKWRKLDLASEARSSGGGTYSEPPF